MVEVTVSVASAFIAAGIAILQFLLPNALALVLTGNLTDAQPAVTWSVVSRFLLSSDWPLFLRSDAATSRSIDRKTTLITWTKPLGLLLTAVAAVVTPLGLYDGVYPSTRLEHVTFVYAPDPGPIANNTMARSQLGFSRTCGNFYTNGTSDRLCPGEPDVGNMTYMYYNATYIASNSSFTYDYVPVSVRVRTPEIPFSLVEQFQSGSEAWSSSLSGYFDVQYRRWTTQSNNYTVDNSSYIVPSYKTSASYLLDDEVKMLEGVIADFRNGGIGFRNHSVPQGLQYGAVWEEDILWWTPEIECVNTNMTRLLVTGDSVSSTSEATSPGIVDRGGFVNLQKEDPFPVVGEFYYMNAQNDAKLKDRAYYAAWGANALTMDLLNITTPGTNRSRVDSEIGREFMGNSTFGEYAYNTDWSLPVLYPGLDGLITADYSINISTSRNPEIPNPYNITSSNFTDQQGYCQQTSGGNPVNFSRIDTVVSMVLAPTYDLDGGDLPDTLAPNTHYERQTYVCAAATKANLKTVKFRSNFTHDYALSGLEIISIVDKVYQNENDRPVWAMETPQPAWNLSWINPIWGLMDQPPVGDGNISWVRSDHFYIPAGQASAGLAPVTSSFVDNMPATVAPRQIWQSTLSAPSGLNAPDYSGKNDGFVRMFWQELFRNETGAAKAFKLIWTDMATNFVMGTKGLHTPPYKQPSTAPGAPADALSDSDSSVSGNYPVYILQRRLRYHWVYGIPALLCVLLVGAAVFMAFVSYLCGLGTIDRLKYYLFSTTSGRVLAAYEYPEHNEDRLTHTKDWVDIVGHKLVNISGRSTGVETTDKKTAQVSYLRVRQEDENLPANNTWEHPA